MKAKINQQDTVSIYQSEDIVLGFYLYDSDTIEPIDLTGKTASLCIKNTDASNATFAGVLGVSTGFVSFTLTAAETALLRVGKQNPQLNITDGGGLVDIEVLSNNIEILAPNCL